MVGFVRIFTALFVVAFVSGCTELKLSVSKEDADRINNVAVYSSLSNEMNHIYIGTTVFSNKESLVSVPDWKIPTTTAEMAANELKKIGVGKRVDILGGIDRGIEVDASNLNSLANKSGYDTLLLIEPDEFVANGFFLNKSYGVYRRSTFGIKHTCPYALMTITVWDTKTQRKLLERNGLDFLRSPCDYDSDTPWNDNPSGMSADELNKLSYLIKSIYSNKIIKILNDSGLK